MSVSKELFGDIDKNKKAFRYIIKNRKGMQIIVTDFGAILISAKAKNKKGTFVDVVLGYEELEKYRENFDMLGTTVGRNVNRIENGRFQIDGIAYQLDINENSNNIHSHMEKGFHKVLWNGKIISDNSVCFSYFSPDGENGFPGNLNISVTYTLTEGNGILISYYGECDKKTLLNMTNHSYFNLAGYDSGNILDTIVWIDADYFTPIKKGTIPTGIAKKVEGTPFDFRAPKTISKEIGSEDEQLQMCQGYDHNFILKYQNIGMRRVASAKSPKSNIEMEIYTDLPGLQFYTGNTTRDILGKGNYLITKNCGFCMEPQYYPNSINMPQFPKPVFGNERKYRTATLYQFL